MKILRPCGDYVLIKPFGDDVMYRGALHLPDSAKAKANDGIVLAIGEWVTQIAVGDWVLFSRNHAHYVQSQGEDVVLVSERSVVLVLEEEESDE